MFHGSMVALVTPMKADLSLDEAALRRLVDWHIASGTRAIIAMGTTGEGATATAAEKRQVIEWVVDEARSRVPVIAGTACISVPATVELTRAAMQAGADAALLLAPPYVKPTQEGLYQYFHAVAREVPLPQLIYNVPSRTVCDVLPETIIRLARVPNIVGVKEATGDIQRVKTILAACPSQLDIYSGDDSSALDLILAGGKGVISVTANVAPKQVSLMADAALQGDAPRARALHQGLLPLHAALFIESNPIPTKWALAEMDRISPAIRLPLTPLSSEHHPTLRAALKQAHALA